MTQVARSPSPAPAKETDSITVTLHPDSLRRLLQQQELHVDEFFCRDERSRESVRLMLLKIVGRR